MKEITIDDNKENYYQKSSQPHQIKTKRKKNTNNKSKHDAIQQTNKRLKINIMLVKCY